ncbi:hypothetical protein SAMN02745194_03132 [Roseomonas rosea]|uniref:Uncharacterized protein n=1 Tax=Muricoccus roseus TaxID=198092 RepID=A0A1M6LD37_9PROT|nr:hypothetical protein [Roseomonas rosea]SHJ69048.1 hypothetical protein SAMN02745194_03132 [Roseomonas rosea]
MSATHRAAIRDKVTEILRAGVAEAAGRVFRARTWPLQGGDYPGYLVYGWEEELKRSGGTAQQTYFEARFLLAVEARVSDESTDAEDVEAQLERLTGAARDLVLTSPELTGGDTRMIERFDAVKTTLGIDTRNSELALGRGLVVFEVVWPEVFETARPEPDCGCEESSLAFRPVPASPAP